MKRILIGLIFLLPLNVFAIDPAIIKSNNDFFDILHRIEIIKDKSRPLIERQKEFSNFANEFGDPGAHWQKLKIGVLDIIISDAAFWAQEMTQFPAIQEKLIKDFSMDWYEETTSNYAEKILLAKTELTRELEKIEIQKAMLTELKLKLNNTHATKLE